MKFISINNKNLIIDDLVFKYTKKVRIMDNDYEVCALSEKDSLKILYNVPKGRILKLYLLINNDWLYYEKIVYNYETLEVNKEMVENYLLARSEKTKEIIENGIVL